MNGKSNIEGKVESVGDEEFVLREPWHQIIDFSSFPPHFTLNEENLKRVLKGHYQKNIAIIGYLFRGPEFDEESFHSFPSSSSLSQDSEFQSIKQTPQPGIFLLQYPTYLDEQKITILTIGLKGIPGNGKLNEQLATLLTLFSSLIISTTKNINETEFIYGSETKEFEGFELVEAPYGKLIILQSPQDHELNENVFPLFKSIEWRKSNEDFKTIMKNCETLEEKTFMPLKVFGRKMSSSDFLDLAKSYVEYFRTSANIDELLERNKTICLNSILQKSLWAYCDEMTKFDKTNFLTESSLYEEHTKAEERAKSAFISETSEIDDEIKNPVFERLEKLLLKEFAIFQNLNLATKEEFASQVIKMSEEEFVKEFLCSLAVNESAFLEKEKFNTSFGLDANYILKLLEDKFKDHNWDEGEFEQIMELVQDKFTNLKEEFWKLNETKMADAEEEIKLESQKVHQFYVEALEKEFAFFEREWRVKEYCEIMHKKSLRMFSNRAVKICPAIHYMSQYAELDARLGETGAEFKERNLKRLERLDIDSQKTAKLRLKSFESNFNPEQDKIPFVDFIIKFCEIKKKIIEETQSETFCFYETYVIRIKLAELINSSFLPLAHQYSFFTMMSVDSALDFTLQHYLRQLREFENKTQDFNSVHDVDLVKKLFDILRAETSEIIGYFIEKIRFPRNDILNFEAKVKGNYYAAVERWTIAQNDKKLLSELEQFLVITSEGFLNELNRRLDSKLIKSIRELTLAGEEMKAESVKFFVEKCKEMNLNSLEMEEAEESLIMRLEAKEKEALDKIQTMILHDYTQVSKGREIVKFGFHLVGDLIYTMGNCLKFVGFFPLFIVAVTTCVIVQEIEEFFQRRRMRNRYHLNSYVTN